MDQAFMDDVAALLGLEEEGEEEEVRGPKGITNCKHCGITFPAALIHMHYSHCQVGPPECYLTA
jgi:hypothetical protein